MTEIVWNFLILPLIMVMTISYLEIIKYMAIKLGPWGGIFAAFSFLQTLILMVIITGLI